MGKVRVGVIGVGNMGKNHARVFGELASCDLVALADPVRDLSSFCDKFGCKAYTDFKEMIANESLDAVSVCVPTTFHKDVGVFCLESGLHVLLEKPIAVDTAEASLLEQAATANAKTLFIGHIERFNPAVRKLKQLLQAKELGDIVSVVIRRVGIFPPQIKDADIIVDVGIHDIDLLRFLFGKRLSVIGATGGKAINDHRTDYYQALIAADGVSCLLQGNWITPIKIRTMSVTGTDGYIELDFITQEMRRYATNKEKEFDDYGDFVIKFGEPTIIPVDVEKGEPLQQELQAFLDCVVGDTSSLMPAAEATLALETAEAIKRFIE